jgi:hypothetical protein
MIGKVRLLLEVVEWGLRIVLEVVVEVPSCAIVYMVYGIEYRCIVTFDIIQSTIAYSTGRHSLVKQI